MDLEAHAHRGVVVARDPPSRIAILARTVRSAHPAVRTFVNSLVAAGVPIYVHGVDASQSEVRCGKVTVATYYAAKGLTFDACITLGAADGVEANPMYVATSRARCRQVLVLDRMRPSKRVVDEAAAAQYLHLRAHTRRSVSLSMEPKNREWSQTTPPLVDVSAWEPRGRAPEVHAAIGTSIVSLSDDEHLSSDCIASYEDVQEEVSDVYVLAALMCEEFEATGKCKRLTQVLSPQKASLSERTKRARNGDGLRLIDERTKNEELLQTR